MAVWEYGTITQWIQRLADGPPAKDVWNVSFGRPDGTTEVLAERVDPDERKPLVYYLTELGKEGWEAFAIDTLKGMWGTAQGFTAPLAQNVSWVVFLKREIS